MKAYENHRERNKRLIRDVVMAFGTASSGAGFYVLAIHLFHGDFGAIGDAIWVFISNFSNLWYEICSRIFDFELSQFQRNAITLYLIFGATFSRAWHVYALELPIQLRFKRYKTYNIEEFQSENILETERKFPIIISIGMVFLWPILVPFVFYCHDGFPSIAIENTEDECEYRYWTTTTRASYRIFALYQLAATFIVGVFVMSADRLF